MPRNDKETIVFVANVGSLGDSDSNKEFVDNAKQLMKHIIEKKIFLEPKDEVGIILMGVDVGINALEFDNIEDYQPIQVCNWDIVEKVLDITPTDFPFMNWITGLEAAVHLMDRDADDAKRKTIVVIMDCPEMEISQDAMKHLATNILQHDIALLWIGTSSMLNLGRELRNNSEKMVQRLCRRVNGRHATFSEIIPSVRFYGGKQPKPTGWQCNLEISDIRIPTVTYLYITKNVPLSAWKTVAENPESKDTCELINVKKNKALVDHHKNEYEIEDIVRGYQYGRTFIPMTDDVMAGIKSMDTNKSLILYGFVPKEKVKLSDRCGQETHMVLPSEGAETHFFSLVKAMTDLNVVAIVRKVYRDKCDPTMKLLYPQSDELNKPWCLFMIELMFKENLGVIESRTYEEIYKCITDDQWTAVDDLIDKMMLKDPTDDDDDKRTFESGTIPAPHIQHAWNQIAHRALHPLTDESPSVHPPADYILELISQPKYLQDDVVDECINRVVELFELNKVELVETTNILPNESSTASEKSNDTGYVTQASAQSNNPPTQMDVDLDALFD